jgi:hypothetical protein
VTRTDFEFERYQHRAGRERAGESYSVHVSEPKVKTIFVCFPQNFNKFFPDREDPQRVVEIDLLKPRGDFYELLTKGARPVFSQDWSEGDGFDISNQRADLFYTVTPVNCVKGATDIVQMVSGSQQQERTYRNLVSAQDLGRQLHQLVQGPVLQPRDGDTAATFAKGRKKVLIRKYQDRRCAPFSRGEYAVGFFTNNTL